MRVVVVAMLLLSACDQAGKKDDVTLAFKSGEQGVEIVQLRQEIADLKAEQERENGLLTATSNLAQSTYDAHESLRQSFNKGVDWDNKHAQDTYSTLQNLDRRLSRYDGQRITNN